MTTLAEVYNIVKKWAGIILSVFVCVVAVLLPFRLRELFVFIMHFVFNAVSVKLRLLFNMLMSAGSFVLLLPVYFIFLPVTVILRFAGRRDKKSVFVMINDRIDHGDVFRIF